MTNATEPDPASETWLKAKLHLAEAENPVPQKTPGAAIHPAYYAMHHAARAALIRTDADKAPLIPGDRKVDWYARGVGGEVAREIKGIPAGRQPD